MNVIDLQRFKTWNAKRVLVHVLYTIGRSLLVQLNLSDFSKFLQIY